MAEREEFKQIVGLGEILWDVFPDGPRFGGAPANFACSAAELAGDRHEVAIVSRVGVDSLGDRACSELEAHGVSTEYVARSGKPTGTVDVTLDARGHASYTFADDTAWDELQMSDTLRELAGRTDAVCFGTLAQRSEVSRDAIRQFVAAAPAHALRVFDINIRRPYYTDEVIDASLKLANVFKLNDDELPIVAKLAGIAESEPAEMLQQIARHYELDCVALTRGSEGALVVRGDEVSRARGRETKVIDTVGAGDAFTSALVLGLLDGLPVDVINQRACEIAAYVCSHAGATPEFPEELVRG